MKSIFIKVYITMMFGVLLATASCYVVYTQINHWRQEQFVSQNLSAAFRLIAEGIGRHVGDEQQQWISTASSLLGAELKLVNVESNSSVKHEKRFNVQLKDGLNALVVSAPLSATNASAATQEVTAQLNGVTEQQLRLSAFLVINDLARLPLQERKARFEQLKTYFSFPLQFRQPTESFLDNEQRRRIAAGEIVVTAPDERLSEGSVYVYAAYGNGQRFLEMGPISRFEPRPWSLLAGLGFAFVLITMAISYWSIRGLEKRLSHLDDSTHSIRNSFLSARIDVQGGDAIARVGLAINSLIERIQQLVTAQQFVTQAVAHDLRTPLSRLRFRLELLDSKIDDTEAKTLLAGVDRDLGELNDLVNEVIEYAKLEVQDDPLNMQWADVAALLQELLAKIDNERQLTVALQGAEKPLFARFNRTHLSHAIRNLLSNAMRHATQKVVVTLQLDHEMVVIDVSNDGPAIASEQRRSLFQPLFRLPARSSDGQGLGLGLAIVYRMMTLHQGEAVLHSGEQGPCFRLRWPQGADEARSSNNMQIKNA